MIALIVNILKVLGILLLVLLGFALLLILLVLFIPVRYTLNGQKGGETEQPLSFRIKVTWLLHILNMQFCYPDAAYLRVRVFCFTVFRSDREKASSDDKPEPQSEKTESGSENKTADRPESSLKKQPENGKLDDPSDETKDKTEDKIEDKTENKKEAEQKPEAEEEPTKRGFFKKLISLLKNIKYTITKICDKIKDIIKNIRYYLEILKSDSFKNAFSVCKTQIFTLLKRIRPGKIKGNLLIGTGDPASTGQVLAVYGMLYPFIGNNIILTPDFENQIIEGDLLIKGKITVFGLLKSAWIIFFNKDIRRVIKLLKREAA